MKFRVGDRVKASDDFMEKYPSLTYLNCREDLYKATINNEEIIVKETGNHVDYKIYCESFTSSDKIYYFGEHRLQLAKNDGKLRFTYSEVPSGTEYSNFLSWSRRHK